MNKEQYHFDDSEPTIPEVLTADEARTVELPSLLHPIRRLGRLAELGAGYNLVQDGMSPLPQYMTRGDLVRTAEAHERAVQTLELLKSLSTESEE